MAINFYLVCVFSVLYFAFMRWRLYGQAEILNAKALTPADYCIAAFTGQDFEDSGDSENILQKVKEVFEERFSRGEKVQYVNAAYNISNFYEVSERYAEINKDIAMVNYYINKRKTAKNKETDELEDPDYNEDSFRADSQAEKQPKGFPKKKAGPGFCAKKVPLDLDALNAELEEVKGQI